jgi:hypothetical protein
VGLAILAGVGAMIVATAVYAFVIKTTDGREIGWMAFGVAALVAFGLAKVGGRHPVLPVAGIVLAVLGVFVGQLLGVTLVINDVAGDASPGVLTILTDHLGEVVWPAFKEYLSPIDALFYLIAAAEGFILTRRISG